jgi:hypothetical protein
MSGGYAPLVLNPGSFKIQTMSNSKQVPFFFGASQVPLQIGLKHGTYSGSGMVISSTDPTVNPKKLYIPR